MSEDQALLDRIGKLAGRSPGSSLVVKGSCSPTLGQINLHRTQTPLSRNDEYRDSWNKSKPNLPKDIAPRPSPRMVPYSRGRGHGRASRIQLNPHRNRTLVLNGKVGTTTLDTQDPSTGSTQPISNAIKSKNSVGSEPPQSANNWVTKRDRHMQLINSSIYDKEAQVRNKAIEDTRKQKAARRDQRERRRVDNHLKSLAARSGQNLAATHAPEILVSGLRFHVIDGGSKLVRIRGESFTGSKSLLLDLTSLGASDSTNSTPKQTNIGGVTFVRSKNGNLYRSGIIKARRSVPTTHTGRV